VVVWVSLPGRLGDVQGRLPEGADGAQCPCCGGWYGASGGGRLGARRIVEAGQRQPAQHGGCAGCAEFDQRAKYQHEVKARDHTGVTQACPRNGRDGCVRYAGGDAGGDPQEHQTWVCHCREQGRLRATQATRRVGAWAPAHAPMQVQHDGAELHPQCRSPDGSGAC
jgi:hypothetical protein